MGNATIEVHDVTAVMAGHDKRIENTKCGGRDREEINPRYTVGMVFEKRPPGSPVSIDGVT